MGPGKVIASRFVIERLVAEGGMGAVYRARDLHTDGLAALKLARVSESQSLEGFARETRVLSALRHPGLVRYLGHGRTESGELYLATEWLDGEDLGARLAAGEIGLAESVELITQVAAALAVAHARRIVHCGLKPSNLFLVDYRLARVKVLGFGVARLVQPEGPADARADVFALGVVLFRCLTGQYPFTGETPAAVRDRIVHEEAPRLRALRPELPRAIDDLVARMLAQAPADRPADAAAVLAEVLALDPTPASCVLLIALERPDEQLRSLVAEHGGELRTEAGATVMTMPSGRVATDQARLLARCALAVRRHLDVPMALVMGRLEARTGTADAAARARRLLGGEAGQIRIDEATAGLLGARFTIAGDARGLALHGAESADYGAHTLPGKPASVESTDVGAATTQSPADLPADAGGNPARTPEGALTVGSLHGKRYTVKRLLGRGGMGSVYLAVDEVLGKEVALKLVDPRLAENPERLRDEVLLAHEVTHRNVCRTYDLEEVEGQWLVKMEYIDGQTLADKVASSGRLSVAEARSIGRQIAQGLAAAHERGVVHRDLKPQNVLVEKGSKRVALMDFGVARLAALAGKTAEGIAGTPTFMAPEQARGREVDGRADLYALGCVLYYMLTGQVVFPAKTAMAAALRQVEDPPPDPRALRAEIPARLALLILRLLEKDPARRPTDAAQVAAELASPPPRGRLVALLGLMAVTASIAAGLAWRAGRTQPEWRPIVRELTPSYEENADGAVFSPDGTLIAYPSDRERAGFFRIYVDSLADGKSRAVTPPELNAAISSSWTRDGRAILFRTLGEGDTFRVSVTGGEPERIARGSGAAVECGPGRLVFSRSNITSDGQAGLILRAADGSERELVRLAPGAGGGAIRCDRTGQKVVYEVGEETPIRGHGRSDIWLVALDGSSPRQLTHDGKQNSMATFHPDGKSVVFSSARGGKQNLWDLPLAGGPLAQISFGEGPDIAPDIAPDGKTLLYNIDVTNIPIIAYDERGQRRLTSRAEDTEAVAVAPDGRHLVATIRRSGALQVVVIPTAGGDEHILVEGRTPCFTPDGGEVVYSVATNPTRVYAIPRAGGTPRVIGEVPGLAAELDVGPDGMIHIGLFGAGGTEAWRIPLSGGAGEREAPAPWFEVVPAPVGGWRAALVAEQGWFAVHLFAPGAKLEEPAARIVHAYSTAWDWDGRSLVYTDGTSIHRLDVATWSDAVIATTPAFKGRVAVAPDRRTVFASEFVAHVRRQLITNFGERPRPP